MSAPPHREIASYSGKRAPLSPRATILSPDERQIAKTSGISEVEYANNKIELERRRRAGQLQSDR